MNMQVYFWNFTNPEEFFAGKEKPLLKEVGPYTYRYESPYHFSNPYFFPRIFNKMCVT